MTTTITKRIDRALGILVQGDGPGSFTQNAIARLSANGDINDSDVTIGDDGVMSGAKVLATGSVTARTLEARFADFVSVKDFGAVGDSNGTTGNGTDDTAEFQAAINFAKATHRRLFVPSGTYRLTSALTADAGLEIVGEGVSPYTSVAAPSRQGGSWLYFDHTGIGLLISQTEPITVSGARVRGVGTMRNQPAPGVGWAPTATGYDIVCETADVFIDDLMFWNATHGLLVSQAANGYGRIQINNLRGQVFQNGITITETYDIPQMSNIRFWPFWADESHVHTYTLANLLAISLYRCDGIQLNNYFCIKANQGISFGENANGRAVRLQFTNVYIDLSINGIVIDTAVTDGNILYFSNLVCFGNGNGSGNALRVRGNNSTILVTNWEASNWDATPISVEGTGNVLDVVNLISNSWNTSGGTTAFVNVDAGNTVRVHGGIDLTNGNGGAVKTGAGTFYRTPGTPATSVDNTVPRYDGTSGQFQPSEVTIGDTGDITAPRYALDGNAYFQLQSGNPLMGFDANDYMVYDRTGNSYTFNIGGTARFVIDSSGNANAGASYQVAGTKVVGAQGALIADASGGATIDSQARTAINALLARMRAHGLIAT